MNIERAKELKIGDLVYCPPDRGEPPYSGRVVYVGTDVYTSFYGASYIWVTVRKDSNSAHVWPSNRLG